MRLQMTTTSNIDMRARTAGHTAAWQPSALYPGAALRRVVCASPSTFNPGGDIEQKHAFRLEGVLRRDRNEIQS